MEDRCCTQPGQRYPETPAELSALLDPPFAACANACTRSPSFFALTGSMMRIALLALPLLFGPSGFGQDGSSLPPLNRKVLDHVEAHMGKRVGTGQCWDLAAAALEAAGARWDGAYGFGRRIDPGQEPVLPGDIVQFEGVEVHYRTATSEHHESMAHHSAIIHAVIGDGRYRLVHQNFGRAGKKVGLTEWSTAHVVKGTYTFFRPVR